MVSVHSAAGAGGASRSEAPSRRKARNSFDASSDGGETKRFEVRNPLNTVPAAQLKVLTRVRKTHNSEILRRQFERQGATRNVADNHNNVGSQFLRHLFRVESDGVDEETAVAAAAAAQANSRSFCLRRPWQRHMWGAIKNSHELLAVFMAERKPGMGVSERLVIFLGTLQSQVMGVTLMFYQQQCYRLDSIFQEDGMSVSHMVQVRFFLLILASLFCVPVDTIVYSAFAANQFRQRVGPGDQKGSCCLTVCPRRNRGCIKSKTCTRIRTCGFIVPWVIVASQVAVCSAVSYCESAYVYNARWHPYLHLSHEEWSHLQLFRTFHLLTRTSYFLANSLQVTIMLTAADNSDDTMQGASQIPCHCRISHNSQQSDKWLAVVLSQLFFWLCISRPVSIVVGMVVSRPAKDGLVRVLTRVKSLTSKEQPETKMVAVARTATCSIDVDDATCSNIGDGGGVGGTLTDRSDCSANRNSQSESRKPHGEGAVVSLPPPPGGGMGHDLSKDEAKGNDGDGDDGATAAGGRNGSVEQRRSRMRKSVSRISKTRFGSAEGKKKAFTVESSSESKKKTPKRKGKKKRFDAEPSNVGGRSSSSQPVVAAVVPRGAAATIVDTTETAEFVGARPPAASMANTSESKDSRDSSSGGTRTGSEGNRKQDEDAATVFRGHRTASIAL